MNKESYRAMMLRWSRHIRKTQNKEELAIIVVDALKDAYETGWNDAIAEHNQSPLNGDRWENEGGQ